MTSSSFKQSVQELKPHFPQADQRTVEAMKKSYLGMKWVVKKMESPLGVSQASRSTLNHLEVKE